MMKFQPHRLSFPSSNLLTSLPLQFCEPGTFRIWLSPSYLSTKIISERSSLITQKNSTHSTPHPKALSITALCFVFFPLLSLTEIIWFCCSLVYFLCFPLGCKHHQVRDPVCLALICAFNILRKAWHVVDDQRIFVAQMNEFNVVECLVVDGGTRIQPDLSRMFTKATFSYCPHLPVGGLCLVLILLSSKGDVHFTLNWLQKCKETQMLYSTNKTTHVLNSFPSSVHYFSDLQDTGRRSGT